MSEQSETSALNIYQRLAKVRESVSYLQKTKDGNLPYSAVRHDQVNEAIRPAMIEYGVIAEVHLKKGKSVDSGKATSRGTPIIRYEAVYDIHFVNIDAPEERAIVTVSAHADDEGDKAPGKAISYAVKMAELKLFNISTGDDDEARVDGVSPKAIKEQEEAQSVAEEIKDQMLKGDVIAVGRLTWKHKKLMEAVHASFDSKGKAEVKEFEGKYHVQIGEWAEELKALISADDAQGVNQFWSDVNDQADRTLLWGLLSDPEHAYIRNVRDA